MIANVDFKEIAEEAVNKLYENSPYEINVRGCDFGEGGSVCFYKQEFNCDKFLEFVKNIKESIKLSLDVAGVEDYNITIKFNCNDECCILFTQGSD
jgi:hypothetical protein